MTRLNAANNARTTLSSGLLAGATELSVASATGFPAAPFMIVVFNGGSEYGPATGEYMRVTQVVGTTFTVTRAQEGSADAAHDAAEYVWCVWTKGTYHELVTDLDGHLVSTLAPHVTSDEKAALGGTSGTPSGTNKYVTNDDSRNTNARTPTNHNLIDTTGHPVAGLTTGHVIRASGATAYAFAQLSHADLASVSADQHHAQNHALISTTGHTASGLTTGHVIRASGATTYVFAQLSHADLGSVSADQHHAQNHALIDTTGHPVTGLTAGHILRATGATTYAFGAMQTGDLVNHNLIDTTKHPVSGLTAGQVIRASAAAAYAFAQLSHADLGSVSSDQHHAQNHALINTSGHTASGLTTGHVIRASGSTTYVFAQLSHADLGSVSADQHHAQNHALINTSGHTASGLTTGHFLKATGATTYAFAAHGLTAADVGAPTTADLQAARVRAYLRL